MTFQKKIEKAMPSKKITPEIREFAKGVDQMRKALKNTNISLSQVLLDARRGK